MDELLQRIKQRASNPATIHDMAEGLAPAPQINPALTLAQVQQTENELGFKFPELWVRIYTEIGNGGFGPGYGLYKLEVAKKLYLEFMAEPENEWEKGTFPLCTWGCGIDSYVDCADEDNSVYYTNGSHGSHNNPITFTMTDKDGNVITSGNADNLLDALNKIGGGNDNGGRPDDRPENDDDQPGLLFHKDTLADWFSDWCNDVNLWDEMSGGNEEDEEEDEEVNDDGPPDDWGRGR
ncbi:MAG TPA: SMI1/KNR4 family protein [Bacteroidia bacterium]|jgi:hypothetical protein